MRIIPLTIRTHLQQLDRMKRCALSPYILHHCSLKIDFHHNLIFGGHQSDIAETIIALCSDIHRQANNKDVKKRLDWIMLNQMSDEQIRSVSKAINYQFVKKQLNTEWKPYPSK